MATPPVAYVYLPQFTPTPFRDELYRLLQLLPKNSWDSADSDLDKGLIIKHESQADKDHTIQELLKYNVVTANSDGTYMFEEVPVTFIVI